VWLAAGVAGLVTITARAATSSSCSCFTETGVESTTEVSPGTAIGLGQLSTPPAWTVLHHAQNAGRVPLGAKSGFMAAGAGPGTGRSDGPAGAGGAGCGGFDATIEGVGCAVSSR
jgi:hypothetical protein